MQDNVTSIHNVHAQCWTDTMLKQGSQQTDECRFIARWLQTQRLRQEFAGIGCYTMHILQQSMSALLL